MERIRPPKVVLTPRPVLSEDELRALLKVCEGASAGHGNDAL